MDDAAQFIKELKGPIIVTGASGFIGANLLKRLLIERKDVYGLIRNEAGWRLWDVDQEQLIQVDINDTSALKALVSQNKPQTVFDCAAYGAYSFESEAPLIYRTNFQARVELINLLAEQQIYAYVHAGSSSEYGSNSAAPTESDACLPNSHYSVSKLNTAEFIKYMGTHKRFPGINLRLYSVYGELEDTSRLIPTLLYKAASGVLPPFVDARTSRDFVYINDVCEAFIFAAAKMNPALYGHSINIGSGTKTSIGQLAEHVAQQFNIAQKPKFGAMQGRSWDLPDWYSNPQFAQQAIGWQAKTDLTKGLLQTMVWVSGLNSASLAQASKQNKGGKQGSVSAIIACYKDAQAIPIMHQRLTETFQTLGVDYEIIFVNDGSPDNSADVIKSISQQDAHVLGITHSRNFGSQMAFRSGMELSTKDAVVLLDGDLQDPPEIISDFYQKWREGNDVVYGRRIRRDMPYFWGLLYKAFYRVFAAFSYIEIPLDAGDFSLLDKRVVNWLLSCGERDLFLRGLRAYVGFKQTGVDYARPERMFGTSTNNLFKNIEWAKRGIFSFSNKPLTILTGLGALSLILSMLLALVAITLKAIYPEVAPKGITTTLVAILVLGSLNLFGLGLIGEYIAKILTEVKLRPAFIRSSLIRLGNETRLSNKRAAMRQIS